MLDHKTREAILALEEKGLSIRRIAKTLKVSRPAVRTVIEAGTAEIPRIVRDEKAEPYRERILELITLCKGNLVRVHEILLEEDCQLSYPALTAFCRRHHLARQPTPHVGRYEFGPAVEFQHDTSPHWLTIGGQSVLGQAASAVLCYSRMLYFQYFPRFRRFECKVFLTDALKYFGGSCAACMIDNTHVVILRGTGANMVPVPEMEAFAERFGFAFRAHEVGDANRSGRVERPFHYIENNFLAGRTFADWSDLNGQAEAWCDERNRKFKRHLRAKPIELFAAEQSQLRPLPDWIPEVYEPHWRLVDSEGYVCVDTNRYSVPLPSGRRVVAHQLKERIDIYNGPRLVASHQRVLEPKGKRVTDPKHRLKRPKRCRNRVSEVEQSLLALAPELDSYVSALKRRSRRPAIPALQRLLSMAREFPRGPLLSAVAEAEHYGLFDLHRVEQMVLRRIASDFFILHDHDPVKDHDDE